MNVIKDLDAIQMNFIIGPGRSGTTLLMLLLNESDACVASPEVKHVMHFYNKYHDMDSTTASMKKEYLNYFSEIKKASTNPLYAININALASVFDTSEPLNYAQLNKKIHLALHQKTTQSIQAIVDKNNLYTFNVEKLLSLYPAAKIVVLIRDYRAFVVSNVSSQHQFKDNKSEAFFGYVWREYAREIHRLAKKYPDTVSITTYEDLVTYPKKVVSEIYKTFGLTYSDTVFEYYKNIEEKVETYLKREHPDPRIVKKISDLAHPITNERINNWRTKLNAATIERLDAICHKEGPLFGYTPLHKISSLKRFILLFFTSFTALRVRSYFKLNSIRLHHYLNVKKRVKHNTIHNY